MPSTRQPRKPRRSPSNVTPSSSQAGDHELATPSSSRASPKPSTTSTAIPKAVDYELDTPWGFGEPSKAGEAEPEVEVLSSTPPDIPKPKVRPPPGYGAPPGLRAPPGLVPNRQPNKPYRDPQVAIDRRLQLHSVDLLELGLGAGGFAEPGWLEYPSESEGGITTDIEFISPYADENGDPALVTLHQPVGIQMDNEGDVAERAGLPPNCMSSLFTTIICSNNCQQPLRYRHAVIKNLTSSSLGIISKTRTTLPERLEPIFPFLPMKILGDVVSNRF